MLLEDETIEIEWTRRGKSIYITKGYPFTKIGDKFKVKQKDISENSHYEVAVLCDYCKEIFHTKMVNYSKAMRINPELKKSACSYCKREKQDELCLIKYGVKTTLQLDDVKEKIKATNLERYGFENPSSNSEVAQKRINTLLQNHGVEYPAQNKEIRQKQIDTTLERYGVKYSLLNEEVKRKSKETLYQNGDVAVSKTQLYLHQLLGGELNYPVGNYNVDILLDNIVIEYNGGGHDLQVKLGNVTKERFDQLELYRDMYLKRRGFKLIKIETKRDRLPDECQLVELIKSCINYLNNGGTNSEINIDKSYIRFGKTINGVKLMNVVRKDKEYFNRIKT